MKLSKHFFLAEFTASQTASRHGINNTPNPAQVENLEEVAKKMEKVRELLGNLPILVSSGYRSPELNKRVRGSATSHHMLGWAVDFTCWSYGTPLEIVKAIRKSGIEFDQLIEEGTWVHISFKPSYRNQVLVADFKNGRATYRQLV